MTTSTGGAGVVVLGMVASAVVAGGVVVVDDVLVGVVEVTGAATGPDPPQAASATSATAVKRDLCVRASLRGPPLVQPSVRLLLAERPLVEAQLQQMIERLAHDRTGTNAEVRHHLVAVEIGTDRVELLLAAQLLDLGLELLHAVGQC